MRASTDATSVACARGAAARSAHAATPMSALRVHEAMVRIESRIGDADVEKRVMTFAALAARAAVVAVNGTHTRQRQTEIDAELESAPDDLGFAAPRVWRVNVHIMRQSERQRPRHR